MESLTFKLGLDGIFHMDTLVTGILEGGNIKSEGSEAIKLWEVACLEAE